MAEATPKKQHQAPRVLALVPDQLLSASLEADLSDAGVDLAVTADPEQVFLSCTEGDVNLVILPAFLPGANAMDLAERLRLDSSLGRPAVLLLGLDEGHRRQAHEIPGAAYLEIPFGPSDLAETVTRLVRAKPLILLADDSKVLRDHVASLLGDAGYEVIEAEDGAAAMTQVRTHRPDLVITDIEMPEMDGYAVCRAIKEDPDLENIPVVICSARGDTLDLERGFESGADDYLVKPVDAADLLTRVRRLLAGLQIEGRETILVVEDSAPVRRLVADSLARQGFLVQAARNGKEGFEKVLEIHPDLVITDHDMPEWTGFELVHAMKRNPETKDIPVVMLTARQSERDQARMRAVGLESYLVKPFSTDKCVAVVERLLAERRLRDYKRASQLYLSKQTADAAEVQAATGQVGAVRAKEEIVTVLFADLVGFTSLSASRSPADVVAFLNEYFDRICPVIFEQRGDIDKFIGDAVMAVFSDDEGESGALRAVRAGLGIQAALAGWTTSGGVRLLARVGINRGPAIRGDLGSRLVRRDYTVIGDTVNRAQRFESQAPRGGVLVSESTYAEIRDRVRAKRIDGLALKGVSEPVTGYVIEAVLQGPQPPRRESSPKEAESRSGPTESVEKKGATR